MLVRDPRKLGRHAGRGADRTRRSRRARRPASRPAGAARSEHGDPPRGLDSRPARRPGRGAQRPRDRPGCCAPPRAPAWSASCSSRRSARPRSSAPASSAPRRWPSVPCSSRSWRRRSSHPRSSTRADDPWVRIQRRLALLPGDSDLGSRHGRLRADLGRGRRPLRARRPRAGARLPPPRARRARSAQLRRDRDADRALGRARAPARARAAGHRAARPRVASPSGRRRGVRDLGGGGADGGADGQRARAGATRGRWASSHGGWSRCSEGAEGAEGPWGRGLHAPPRSGCGIPSLGGARLSCRFAPLAENSDGCGQPNLRWPAVDSLRVSRSARGGLCQRTTWTVLQSGSTVSPGSTKATSWPVPQMISSTSPSAAWISSLPPPAWT